MKKIRVLQLITGLPLGGAEKVLLDLCSNLDKDVIENHVIGLNDEIDFKEDFIQNKIIVKNLNMTRDLKSFFKTARFLNNYIKDKKIDVLHSHMFHPLIFALILKIMHPKLKIVFTSHNINIGSKSREMLTFLLKPFRDIDVVFSKDMITKMYKKDTRVIPNGIDVSAYNGDVKKNKKFTFISVGVLREQKNQLFLPSCASYLKNKGIKNFEIAIVGGADASGDMREEIDQEIVKYDVSKEINMMGPRRDISELLQKAHCFVMPSNFEGLPIALLEAGASNIPIISTPVGAIPSIIDESCGYLSDLDNFAKTMFEVIQNQPLAEKKAKKLKTKIEKEFSIKSMAKAHEEIYSYIKLQK